jgi:hypothetical protein
MPAVLLLVKRSKAISHHIAHLPTVRRVPPRKSSALPGLASSPARPTAPTTALLKPFLEAEVGLLSPLFAMSALPTGTVTKEVGVTASHADKDVDSDVVTAFHKDAIGDRTCPAGTILGLDWFSSFGPTNEVAARIRPGRQ